jgi:hypothetical protein
MTTPDKGTDTVNTLARLYQLDPDLLIFTDPGGG